MTLPLTRSLSLFLPILCVTVSLPGDSFLSPSLPRPLISASAAAAPATVLFTRSALVVVRALTNALHHSLITFRANCKIWQRVQRKKEQFSAVNATQWRDGAVDLLWQWWLSFYYWSERSRYIFNPVWVVQIFLFLAETKCNLSEDQLKGQFT